MSTTPKRKLVLDQKVNLRETAETLGLTPQYLNTMIRDYDFPKNETIGNQILWYIDYIKKNKSEDSARQKFIEAQTRLLELKIQEKELELIPVATVKEQWTANVLRVANKFQSIPHVAGTLLANQPSSYIETKLQDLISEALAEFGVLK